LSKPRTFSTRLLAWWDQHGRKDLPWQHLRTPYRVWVAEIMLQQTQVSTVIPYFECWMQRFPDLAALAQAPLDEVLAHWAGLGYYARARNLQRAAQACVAQFGDTLPATAEALAALPGIGRSTAQAIRSQSTDQPAAVLDGNVRRVLARHARVDGWTGSTAVQKKLWAEAERRLPRKRGADYTQAIMDLGALVCTRAKPGCSHCPVNADCRAWSAGVVDQYPAPRPKTRVSDRDVFLLILQDDAQRVLLEKRPPAGIWGGLWSLPEAESLHLLEEKVGLALGKSRLLPPREHRLTHLRMNIQPVLLGSMSSAQVKCPAEHCWWHLVTVHSAFPSPLLTCCRSYLPALQGKLDRRRR
jgi:A/G-specific adenine glycosylase